MTNVPISFTEDGLDEIERRLRKTTPSDSGYAEEACQAADAIAYLRRGRVPREPTQAMLDAVSSFSRGWAQVVWQTMYDAAPVGKP